MKITDIFKSIFNEGVWISITISLKFVPKGPIDYKSALVQVMAWHRTGEKPLPESMLTKFTEAYISFLARLLTRVTCLIDAPGSFGDFYVWAPPAYIMFWTLLLWMYQDPGHLTLYGITLLDFLLFCEYVLSFSVQNSQYRSPWNLFKFPGESVAMETMLVVW